MLALQVRLDFTCCVCARPMGVTLLCEGQGLADNPMTTVKVPCPTCGQNNQIFFTPDGALHRVTRERVYYRVPELSCN